VEQSNVFRVDPHATPELGSAPETISEGRYPIDIFTFLKFNRWDIGSWLGFLGFSRNSAGQNRPHACSLNAEPAFKNITYF